MAYSFDVNNTGGANGGQEVVFDLKELLKSVSWVIRSSSDGTTYNAGGDQITSAGSGANGLGNSNAWFVIRGPVAMLPRREFMFQRGTDNRSWKISMSAEDGYVGGAPNATTPPTATDEQYLIGSSGSFDTTFFPAVSTYKYHCGADATSPYSFYAIVAANGTAALTPVMIFDPMSAGSYPSADDDPAIYHFTKTATPMAFSVLGNSTNGPKAWYRKDQGGELFVVMPATRLDDDTGQLIPSNTGSNPYDADDNTFPIGYGRRSGLTTQVGWKGFGGMLRWLGTSRANGDTLSTSGTKDKIVVDNCTLPWPNLVPSI